jgi:hypothetical protein
MSLDGGCNLGKYKRARARLRQQDRRSLVGVLAERRR